MESFHITWGRGEAKQRATAGDAIWAWGDKSISTLRWNSDRPTANFQRQEVQGIADMERAFVFRQHFSGALLPEL